MCRKILYNYRQKEFPYFCLIILVCLIGGGVISSLPSAASGPAEFVLGWDANEEADLDGYEIYYRKGEPGSEYIFLAEVYINELEDPDHPVVTITDLYNGLLTDLITPVVRTAELAHNSTYHFALTAFDTQGKTSEFSEELCVEVIGTTVFECGSVKSDNTSGGDSDSSTSESSSDDASGSDSSSNGDSSNSDSNSGDSSGTDGGNADNSSEDSSSDIDEPTANSAASGGGGCFITSLSHIFL
jgi:hypothetical protein